jgi:hypothetical protein
MVDLSSSIVVLLGLSRGRPSARLLSAGHLASRTFFGAGTGQTIIVWRSEDDTVYRQRLAEAEAKRGAFDKIMVVGWQSSAVAQSND